MSTSTSGGGDQIQRRACSWHHREWHEHMIRLNATVILQLHYDTSLLGFGVFVWKPTFTKVVNLNWLHFVFLFNLNWIEYEVPLETCWCHWGFGARPPGRVDTLAEMEGSTQVYHVDLPAKCNSNEPPEVFVDGLSMFNQVVQKKSKGASFLRRSPIVFSAWNHWG